MGKIIRKRFDIKVDKEESSISKTFELDKNILYVKGILLTSDRDDLLYYRGTQKIEFNSEEYFPENYESKLLMSGINVPPKSRYYELDSVITGNGLIRINFKDNPSGLAEFQPYRVSLYVMCEAEELV